MSEAADNVDANWRKLDTFSSKVEQVTQSDQFQTLLASLFQTSLSRLPSNSDCASTENNVGSDMVDKEQASNYDAYAVMPPFEFFGQVPQSIRRQQLLKVRRTASILNAYPLERVEGSRKSKTFEPTMHKLYWSK